MLIIVTLYFIFIWRLMKKWTHKKNEGKVPLELYSSITICNARFSFCSCWYWKKRRMKWEKMPKIYVIDITVTWKSLSLATFKRNVPNKPNRQEIKEFWTRKIEENVSFRIIFFSGTFELQDLLEKMQNFVTNVEICCSVWTYPRNAFLLGFNCLNVLFNCLNVCGLVEKV